MAVYEHTYKQYAGPLTPEWSRFLIIPRHAFRDVFKSKLFTAFFVICFLPLLVEAILIYLHHNAEALGICRTQAKFLIPIDASFFEVFVGIQGGFAFLLTVLVGPPLVARDLTNNGLPLYLCRPFSRAEYVFGKMCVVLDSAFGGDLGAGSAAVFLSGLSRRLHLVWRQLLDRQCDLLEQLDLDSHPVAAVANSVGLGQVENGGERRADWFVFDSHGLRRISEYYASRPVGLISSASMV